MLTSSVEPMIGIERIYIQALHHPANLFAGRGSRALRGDPGGQRGLELVV